MVVGSGWKIPSPAAQRSRSPCPWPTPAMTDRIRVLLVDDHLMFADAIEALLATKDDIEVLGVASSGEEAIEKCRTEAPDVVLMDLDLPGIDGIRATRSITQEHPEGKVVIVSGLRNEEAV